MRAAAVIAAGVLALGGCVERGAAPVDVQAPIRAGLSSEKQTTTSQPASGQSSTETRAGRDSDTRTYTVPITISGEAGPLAVVLAAGVAAGGVLLWLGHRAKALRRERWQRTEQLREDQFRNMEYLVNRLEKRLRDGRATTDGRAECGAGGIPG